MRPIATTDDIDGALDALCGADPRLVLVRRLAGDVPLRRSEAGFASLASIVVSQQISRASADAIFGRLERLVVPLDAAMTASASDALFREIGLSRPKQATLRALGHAVTDGLDLASLCNLPAETAIAHLTRIHGVGKWTAEVYLLVCAGHPDIFPAGDIALQAAVGHALGHGDRPRERQVAAIAESWAPWRSVAARLFWSYYRHMSGRDATPVAPAPQNG